MKILITGGGGFLGRYVKQEVLTLGDIAVLEHPESPLEGKDVLKADIINLEELKEKIVNFDVVVHLAALFFTSKRDPTPTPEKLFEVNVKGTFNILEACVVNGIKKVIFASSITAFGTAPEYLPVKEEDRPKPGGPGSSVYGMTKFLGEGLCQSYTARYEITTLCLRLAVVKDLTERKKWTTSVETLWSYLDVRDAAQAFRLACEKEGLSHEVFFISAEDTLNSIPNRELIRKDMPWISEENITPGFLEQEFISFYSIKKAKKVLGYKPKYTWRR